MTTRGFWRDTQAIDNRLALVGSSAINKVWYLFPQGGGPRNAYTTFTDLKGQLRSRDLVLLSGVLLEQATTPLGVYDVVIAGAANKPRQATDGGVPTGGGASWLSPASPVATTPLLQILNQGWSIENIQFAPVASSDCIRFRRMETAAIPDASHGSVRGCLFSAGGAGGHGINVGECSNLTIEDNDFRGLGTGTAIRQSADGGIANPLNAHIVGNRFDRGNAGDIIVPFNQALIENNVFKSLFATEAGWRINLDGGGSLGNMVINNYVADVDTTIALGFKKAVAADIWRNFVATVVDPKVVVPA